MRVLLPLVLVAAAVVPVQSCDETDVVSIRVQLAADGSGTVTTSSLSLPAEGGPAEAALPGVSFTGRAALTCVTGTFADVTRLRVADLAFSHGRTADGTTFLRVTMPRGPDARWVKLMSPAPPEDRQKAAEAFALAGNAKKSGSSIKLVVDLPKPVIAHGIFPRARGTSEAVDDRNAQVTVPVETVLAAGEPLIWQLTWQR
jgi:hypothetical protein